jgi:hypothetical protein
MCRQTQQLVIRLLGVELRCLWISVLWTSLNSFQTVDEHRKDAMDAWQIVNYLFISKLNSVPGSPADRLPAATCSQHQKHTPSLSFLWEYSAITNTESDLAHALIYYVELVAGAKMVTARCRNCIRYHYKVVPIQEIFHHKAPFPPRAYTRVYAHRRLIYRRQPTIKPMECDNIFLQNSFYAC